MAAAVQLTQDLAIGRENPQRPEGSIILRRWLADRRAAEARGLMQQPRRSMRRSYAGAKTSLINSGWTTMPTPPNWHIWQGLQALRSRSREQYRNNDYARHFVMMCKNNIVGSTGIGLQSKAADPDGTPDTLARDAIEAAWAEWSRKWCDVAARQTMADLCRTIIGTIATDGECLIQYISGGPFGMQLKLIDPELLDIQYNDRLPNGNAVRMGVEMDRNGRHIAYHMLDQSSSDVYQVSYYSGNRHIRVDASEVLHLFLPEMIGQARGVPWMASALVRMKNLHGYEEAAVIASRVGASKMGFFESVDGEGASALADDTDASTGEFIQDAEAGAFEVLPEGYKFSSFNPDYPHQQFPDFVKATLRGIAAGLGVSYNGLANDLENVNFSSIRSGVLEEREQWKTLQDWFIEAFMRPVFDLWLSTQLAIGSIKIPSKSASGLVSLPASRFDKFRQVTFMPRRWAWVDPQKDMDAAVIAIQNGLKSPQRIAAEQGIDIDEVLDEIAAFQAKVKEKGIELTGTSWPASKEPKPASAADSTGGANA